LGEIILKHKGVRGKVLVVVKNVF
jgi:hypothetical protein